MKTTNKTIELVYFILLSIGKDPNFNDNDFEVNIYIDREFIYSYEFSNYGQLTMFLSNIDFKEEMVFTDFKSLDFFSINKSNVIFHNFTLLPVEESITIRIDLNVYTIKYQKNVH